jgi:hypothetical protein
LFSNVIVHLLHEHGGEDIIAHPSHVARISLLRSKRSTKFASHLCKLLKWDLAQNKFPVCLSMPNLWTIAELRKNIYRFVRAISDILEPPEIAVDQLKFEPARSAAVKIALDAGWIQGLRDGCPHSPNELAIPGQSEELLGRSPWSISKGPADES